LAFHAKARRKYIRAPAISKYLCLGILRQLHCEDPLPRNAQPVDVDGPYYDFNADVDPGRLTHIPGRLAAFTGKSPRNGALLQAR
jgi:hypothetical protein